VHQRTADGVRLVGLLVRPQHGGNELAIVVGHGFTNHVRKPFVTRVLRRLGRSHPVIAFDFRGHGRSGGWSTGGPAEVADLDAAVAFARRDHARVATLGFSMGGAVALLQAADGAHRPDAVAAVSSASYWWARETTAMRRLFAFSELPPGRAVMGALGVRLAPTLTAVPPSPVEVAHRIAPTPLLLVHGNEDHYLPVAHAMALHRASGGHGQLWLEPGMRHAETAMTPALVDRLAAWLVGNTRPGTDGSEQTAA